MKRIPFKNNEDENGMMGHFYFMWSVSGDLVVNINGIQFRYVITITLVVD